MDNEVSITPPVIFHLIINLVLLVCFYNSNSETVLTRFDHVLVKYVIKLLVFLYHIKARRIKSQANPFRSKWMIDSKFPNIYNGPI